MKINVGPLLEDGAVEVANTYQLSQLPVIYQILSPFVDESALSLQGGGHKFEPCSAHN